MVHFSIVSSVIREGNKKGGGLIKGGGEFRENVFGENPKNVG